MPPHTSLARKRFRQFLLGVAALHVAAIAGYYLLNVEHAAPRFQRLYAWIWMGLTVVVVLTGLQRLKRARGRTIIRRPEPSRDETDGA